MEKQCLVTTLKAKTENTDLEVYGYMKIKISRIPEESLNEDPWNQFIIKSVGEIKIIGNGFMYKSISDRDTNTNGVKSCVLHNGNNIIYTSNGDYEILIPKYKQDTEIYSHEQIRSDNITIDYKTFKNSELKALNIKFLLNKDESLKYPFNFKGNIRELPKTLTNLRLSADENHTYNIEDLGEIAGNLDTFYFSGRLRFTGSFDNVTFKKVVDYGDFSTQELEGNLKNVPVSVTHNNNYGYSKFNGDVETLVERIAKNTTSGKDIYIYFERHKEGINWKGQPITNMPRSGFIYLTTNIGEVKVYGDEARTNLLGTYNVTSGWTYPS